MGVAGRNPTTPDNETVPQSGSGAQLWSEAMKPTVPFEVMLSAKAIKARPRNYRADDMKIALCDEHGELRVLSAADALADWVIANCEGLPDTTPKPGLIGLEIERIEVDE